jgi:hypothetical protein
MGSLTTAGGKFFALKRLKDNRVLKFSLDTTGNRNGDMWNAANKICGAIKWVNNPLDIALWIAATTAFFT